MSMSVELISILALDEIRDYASQLQLPLEGASFDYARAQGKQLVGSMLGAYPSVFAARKTLGNLEVIDEEFLAQVRVFLSSHSWPALKSWWTAFSPRFSSYDSEWWWSNAIARIASRKTREDGSVEGRLVETAERFRRSLCFDLDRVQNYSARADLSDGGVSDWDRRLIRFFSPETENRSSIRLISGLLVSLGNLLTVVEVSHWWTELSRSTNRSDLEEMKKIIVDEVLQQSPPTRSCLSEPRNFIA
jgi:hypothetical protein